MFRTCVLNICAIFASILNRSKQVPPQSPLPSSSSMQPAVKESVNAFLGFGHYDDDGFLMEMPKEVEPEPKKKEETPAPGPKVNMEKKQQDGEEAQPEGPETAKLTPEEVEKMEKKKERARENSRKWHAKWIKKGVPRESNPDPPAPPAEGEGQPPLLQPNLGSKVTPELMQEARND